MGNKDIVGDEEYVIMPEVESTLEDIPLYTLEKARELVVAEIMENPDIRVFNTGKGSPKAPFWIEDEAELLELINK